TLWRTWQLYAMLFGVLAAAELASVVILLGWPTRRTVRFGAAAAAAPLVVWVLDRVLGILPAPDPWQPADTVLGITDQLAAGLQLVAVLGLLAVAARGPRPEPSVLRWVVASVALFPVIVLVLAVGAAGVTTAGGGFTGTGVPPGAVAPGALPAGQLSTVEYCRPGGIPLAMDLHTPAASPTPAPVVLNVHGGGLILG
ncbi:alpha/beta hydrolase, partial [Amycolatopsis sp. H20-H5]|nr:alpha/beta hydrolase [Amycolatopsis sp. H20-H5]